jgi:hypothetical protein
MKNVELKVEFQAPTTTTTTSTTTTSESKVSQTRVLKMTAVFFMDFGFLDGYILTLKMC